MRNKLNSIKNHISANRELYAFGVASAASIAVAVKLVSEWDEFLKDQGVYDAYNTVN